MTNKYKNILSTTTVLIETTTNDSGSRGTGFMFAFISDDEEDNGVPLIITNKHVLEGAKTIKIRLSTSSAADNSIKDGVAEYIIKSGLEHIIIRHPSEDIDLAAISIAPLLGFMFRQGLTGFGKMFSERDIITPSELEATAIAEDILMIGYPTGLSDYKHNSPITRRGIIASDPTIPFNGKDHFLIDCACFPGSSGSPVVTKEQNFFTDAQGNTVAGKKRSALIGLLWGGPTYTTEGKIIVRNIPANATQIPQLPQMINLGFVISAAKILDLKDIVFNQQHVGDITFELSHTKL